MAFAQLQSYNLNYPTFKYPDLSGVYKQVQDAYLSDKSGEIMASGIVSAGKSIAGIPGQIQDAELNKARVDQLNAQSTALKEGKLIAGAPTPEIVGPIGPQGRLGVGTSVTPNPELPARTTLNSVPAPEVMDAGTGLPEPAAPAWQVPQYDAVSTAPVVGDPSTDALSQEITPSPSPSPRLANVAATPVTPADKAGVQAGLITAPQVTTEAVPGGAMIRRLNGTPTEILPQGEHKFRALTKAETAILDPAAVKSELTAETQSSMAKLGIDPRQPNAMDEYIGVMRSKVAIPKLDRGLQKEVNALNIATEGKTADQVRAEVTAALQAQNRLSEPQLTHVNQLKAQYMRQAPYQKWVSVTDGYTNAHTAAKIGTGLGDKTLVEEGQRVLNPTVGVAVATMKSFGASSGLLERLTPEYIANNWTKGAIFTPEQRSQYLHILDEAIKNRDHEMDKTQENYLKMAKAAGIPEKIAPLYFDNPYEDALGHKDYLKGKATEQPKAQVFDPTEADKWLRLNPADPRRGAIIEKLKSLGYKPSE